MIQLSKIRQYYDPILHGFDDDDNNKNNELDKIKYMLKYVINNKMILSEFFKSTLIKKLKGKYKNDTELSLLLAQTLVFINSRYIDSNVVFIYAKNYYAKGELVKFYKKYKDCGIEIEFMYYYSLLIYCYPLSKIILNKIVHFDLSKICSKNKREIYLRKLLTYLFEKNLYADVEFIYDMYDVPSGFCKSNISEEMFTKFPFIVWYTTNWDDTFKNISKNHSPNLIFKYFPKKMIINEFTTFTDI